MSIFPGFPVVNSPLLVRFYVRLQVNSSVSVVLERTVLTSILDRVLENLTAEFGVQFSGKSQRSKVIRKCLIKDEISSFNSFFIFCSAFHCLLIP